MFDVLVESTSRRGGARTWAFFAASSAFWMVALAAVAIAGVFTYDAKLDAEFDRLGLVAVVPPAPSQPRPSPARRTETTSTTPTSNVLRAATEAPREIAPPRIAPSSGSVVPGPTDGGHEGDVAWGVPGSQPGGDPTADARPVPPPPSPPVEPPAEPKLTPPAPRRPVSRVLAGIVTKRVEPQYPQMAIQTGVKGDVVVEVTVSETGGVISTHVISGHPLLRGAAEQAARQWRFTPTVLGDTPVKVIGTITFSFKR